MKSAIIATIIGSAAAFAPAPVAKTTTAVNAFEDELGAQPPLGFFDPFGMLSGDVTQERFDRLRYVEIKHGRIAQLAFLGQIVTRAGIHLPGNIDYGKLLVFYTLLDGDRADVHISCVLLLLGPHETHCNLRERSREKPTHVIYVYVALNQWSAGLSALC